MTLDQLHRQHYKHFISKVYPYLHSREAAEEVVQDAFVHAIEKMDQYDSTKSSLKTWFTHVLFSCLWNHLRKNKKALKTCELEALGENEGIDISRAGDLAEIILNIPNRRHQHILFCRFILGNDYPEVSDITGYTQDNVRKIVQRFRETVL